LVSLSRVFLVEKKNPKRTKEIPKWSFFKWEPGNQLKKKGWPPGIKSFWFRTLPFKKPFNPQFKFPQRLRNKPKQGKRVTFHLG